MQYKITLVNVKNREMEKMHVANSVKLEFVVLRLECIVSEGMYVCPGSDLLWDIL